MQKTEIKIINKLGLHTRASAKLVKVASRFSSQCLIEFDDKQADAKSIMSIMMLAASQGSFVTVICDGQDEQEASEAICQLINNYFDEGE